MTSDKVPVFARGSGSKRKRGEIPDRPLSQGKVWEYLRKRFYRQYPTGHIVRIEDQVGRGTPDVYYCYRYGRGEIETECGWIELKTGYDKPTELQNAWHARERGAGGIVGVLTIRPSKAILDIGDGPVDLGVLTWDEVIAKMTLRS